MSEFICKPIYLAVSSIVCSSVFCIYQTISYYSYVVSIVNIGNMYSWVSLAFYMSEADTDLRYRPMIFSIYNRDI